jgi:hypothetical protein
MALPYTGTITTATPVTITGITAASTIRILSGPGLAVDMDNSNQIAPNWQQVHQNDHGGVWEGGMVGTQIRLRKLDSVASVTCRIVEV